jgi:hypothetical protein
LGTVIGTVVGTVIGTVVGKERNETAANKDLRIYPT